MSILTWYGMACYDRIQYVDIKIRILIWYVIYVS